MNRRILGSNINLTTTPDYRRLGQLLDEIRANSAVIGGISFGNAESIGQIRYNDAVNRLEIGVDDGSGGVEFIPLSAEGDPITTPNVVAGNITIEDDTISNDALLLFNIANTDILEFTQNAGETYIQSLSPLNIGTDIGGTNTILQISTNITSNVDLDMNNNNITNGGTISGTFSANGAMDMNDNGISNLEDPVDSQDASTKNYVDTNLVWEKTGTDIVPIDTAVDTINFINGNMNIKRATSNVFDVYSLFNFVDLTDIYNNANDAVLGTGTTRGTFDGSENIILSGTNTPQLEIDNIAPDQLTSPNDGFVFFCRIRIDSIPSDGVIFELHFTIEGTLNDTRYSIGVEALGNDLQFWIRSGSSGTATTFNNLTTSQLADSTYHVFTIEKLNEVAGAQTRLRFDDTILDTAFESTPPGYNYNLLLGGTNITGYCSTLLVVDKLLTNTERLDIINNINNNPDLDLLPIDTIYTMNINRPLNVQKELDMNNNNIINGGTITMNDISTTNMTSGNIQIIGDTISNITTNDITINSNITSSNIAQFGNVKIEDNTIENITVGNVIEFGKSVFIDDIQVGNFTIDTNIIENPNVITMISNNSDQTELVQSSTFNLSGYSITDCIYNPNDGLYYATVDPSSIGVPPIVKTQSPTSNTLIDSGTTVPETDAESFHIKYVPELNLLYLDYNSLNGGVLRVGTPGATIFTEIIPDTSNQLTNVESITYHPGPKTITYTASEFTYSTDGINFNSLALTNISRLTTRVVYADHINRYLVYRELEPMVYLDDNFNEDTSLTATFDVSPDTGRKTLLYHRSRQYVILISVGGSLHISYNGTDFTYVKNQPFVDVNATRLHKFWFDDIARFICVGRDVGEINITNIYVSNDGINWVSIEDQFNLQFLGAVYRKDTKQLFGNVLSPAGFQNIDIITPDNVVGLDLNLSKISNLAEPTNANDGVTKNYVDTINTQNFQDNLSIQEIEEIPAGYENPISGTTDIIYANSQFYVIGDNIWTSSDGKRFTQISTQSGFRIIYSGSIFVILDGSSILYSTDAITWTTASTVPATGGTVENLAYGGGQFYVSTTNDFILRSSDGDTWTIAFDSNGTQYNILGLAHMANINSIVFTTYNSLNDTNVILRYISDTSTNELTPTNSGIVISSLSRGQIQYRESRNELIISNVVGYITTEDAINVKLGQPAGLPGRDNDYLFAFPNQPSVLIFTNGTGLRSYYADTSDVNTPDYPDINTPFDITYEVSGAKKVAYSGNELIMIDGTDIARAEFYTDWNGVNDVLNTDYIVSTNVENVVYVFANVNNSLGNNNIIFSSDGGETWTPITGIDTPNIAPIDKFAYFNSRLINKRYLFNINTNLTLTEIDTYTYIEPKSSIYVNYLEILVSTVEIGASITGTNNEDLRIGISNNGTAFSIATLDIEDRSFSLRAIASSDYLRRIITLPDTAGNLGLISQDAKTWNTITVPNLSYKEAVWSPELQKFIAIGSTSPYIAYSADGITWNTGSGINSEPNTMINILGRILVGCNGEIFISTNGEDYTSFNTASYNWNSFSWLPRYNRIIGVSLDNEVVKITFDPAEPLTIQKKLYN